MSEDESSESSFEETSTTLDYMNKELSNTDLRSEFLAQLLKREEERKVILEARVCKLWKPCITTVPYLSVSGSL